MQVQMKTQAAKKKGIPLLFLLIRQAGFPVLFPAAA